MKPSRIIIGLLAFMLTAGVVVGVLRQVERGQAAENAFTAPLPAVTLLRLERKTVPIHETFYGLIEPWQEVALALQVGGRIDVIGKLRNRQDTEGYAYHLDEESRLTKGQQIIRLEDSKAQAQLAAAEAAVAQARAMMSEAKSVVMQENAAVEAARGRVAEAEANQQRAVDDFNRVKRLDDQGIATITEMDRVQTERQAARARMRVARATLDQALASETTAKKRLASAAASHDSALAQRDAAKADLSFTRLLSPIDGVISDLPVEEGEIVSVGQTVAKVLDIDDVKLVVGIVERKISRIQLGATVKVTVEATSKAAGFVPTEPLIGEITRVSVASETQTGLFRVEIKLNNESGMLRPGMIGKADILVDEVECYPIPIEAIVLRNKRQTALFAISESGDRAVARIVNLPPAAETDEYHLLNELPGQMSDLIYEGHRSIKDRDTVLIKSRTTLEDRDDFQTRLAIP